MSASASSVERERDRLVLLLMAAKDGEVATLRRLVREYGSVGAEKTVLSGYRDAKGRTALHFAASFGQSGVVEYVLGAVPDAVAWEDEEGATPLSLAVMGGKRDVAALLLDKGAAPGAVAKDGEAPIHIAARHDFADIVRLLVERGADVDAGSDGGTAVSYAAAAGSEESLAVLLGAGAKATSADAQGITPLMVACASGKLACVKLLLDAGCDPLRVGNGGLSALHLACEGGNRGVVRAVLAAAGDKGGELATATNDDGLKPIHLAAGRGFTAVVEELLAVSGEEAGVTAEALVAEHRARREAEEKAAAAKAAAEEARRKREEDGEAMPAGRMPPEASAEDAAQADAAKARGNELFAAGDHEGARAAYSEAIDLNGRNHVFWSNRSACALELGDLSAALDDAHMCMWLNPDWQKAHFRVGSALMALGRYEDAAGAFWKARAKEPGDSRELRRLFETAIAKAREQLQATGGAASAATASSSGAGDSTSS